MKNKTTLLFIGFTTFWFLANSQVLKTYSGSFEGGKATYQYYETKKYDIVFHRSFSYSGPLFNMKGSFVKGNRNGKWNIYAKDKLYSSNGRSIKLNTNVFGNYKNGELNGAWFYSTSIRFAMGNQDDKEKSFANFYNNHFIGKVTYETNWPEKYTIDGQFDSLGFLTGSWKYFSNNSRQEIKFLNGVAYWKLSQNMTTGKKQDFYDSTSFVKKFWSSYDPLTKTSNVNSKKYCLDTVNIFANRNDLSVKDEVDDPSRPFFNSYNIKMIWCSTQISVFNAISIGNPLYYYDKGCKTPEGFEIVIKECRHSIEKNNDGETGKGNISEIGSGTGDGNSYDLGGRSSRSLPKPSCNSVEQGRVVVSIWVNREGRVTRVSAGAKGTTVTDPSLIRQAESAARQALFSANPDGPEEQIGKIIYNFIKLN
jgi:hypothetical protein